MGTPLTKSGLPRMPRRLSQELARLEYVAITCVAPSEQGPTRVAMARNIQRRFHDLQEMSWLPLKVHFIVWTPGKPVAMRVEQEAHKLLEQKHKHDKWFDVPVRFAANAILLAAERLRVTVFSHNDMIKRCAEMERSSLERARLALERKSYFRGDKSKAQASYQEIEPPPRKRKRRQRRHRSARQDIATKLKPDRDHPYR